MNSNNTMNTAEWTTVIGNGKRMGRKWRSQYIMGEKTVVDYRGREVRVYAPGFDDNGLIVDDYMMRTWLPSWGGNQKYDLSLQPDEDLY